MNYCDQCRVYVLGSRQQCPLCHTPVPDSDGPPDTEGYPIIQDKKAKNRFLLVLLLALSAAVSMICLAVNLSGAPSELWSLIVLTALLLLWETVGFMILSKKNIGWRLFAQMVAVMIVLMTIDAVTGWRAWSIGLLAPFVIVASSLAMSVIFYINRLKWREYMLFQLIIAMNGFIPVILFWCGLTRILWPAAAGALFSLLTFAGMLIFADKQLKNELMKRFHL
jgi:hypothetical protein